MNKPARKWQILIVDDHPIVREGLVRLIEREPDLAVCGEADSVDNALAAVRKLQPDLALLDLSLGDKPGLELVRDLHAGCPGVRLLALSMHDEAVWAERAMRAGACGYVMKQEKPRVLIARLRQALAGGVCLSEKMSEQLLRKFTGHRPATGIVGTEKLGDRELEVLQLLGKGMSTREIAGALDVSIKTVEAHRENLKRKLNIASGPELLRYAVLTFQGE